MKYLRPFFENESEITEEKLRDIVFEKLSEEIDILRNILDMSMDLQDNGTLISSHITINNSKEAVKILITKENDEEMLIYTKDLDSYKIPLSRILNDLHHVRIHIRVDNEFGPDFRARQYLMSRIESMYPDIEFWNGYDMDDGIDIYIIRYKR